MGLRAYFLINAPEDMDQAELAKAIKELTAMPAVESVEPVLRRTSMVVVVDAPITVQALANKITAKPWVKDLQILRLVSIFERPRAVKASKMPIFELAGVGSATSDISCTPQAMPTSQLLEPSGVIPESRAYFLIDTAEDFDQRQSITAIRELEEMPGVDYVDPVIGPPDMVVKVDAPNAVDMLANEVKAKPWVKNLQVLRTAGALEAPAIAPLRGKDQIL